MQLAATLTSLPLAFEEAVQQIAALGFTHVDLIGLTERPASHLEALADSGLLVACAAVGRGLPDGVALDAADVAIRRQAVAHVEMQIAEPGFGASRCYGARPRCQQRRPFALRRRLRGPRRFCCRAHDATVCRTRSRPGTAYGGRCLAMAGPGRSPSSRSLAGCRPLLDQRRRSGPRRASRRAKARLRPPG